MSRVEKGIKIISVFVLIAACLSLVSFSVFYVARGGKRLGVLTEPIRQFASFPQTAITVFKSYKLKGIPPSYTDRDTSFREVNNLKYDIYGLNSFYNIDQDLWEIKLFNFKNDSVIHKWQLKKELYKRRVREYENSEPENSILLPDRSLITGFNQTRHLFKIDRNSNIIWKNTSKLFHHALNIDDDGNIWACTSASRGVTDYNRKVRTYRDDYITKVSAETGEIIFDKSVSEVLIENGYKNFVYGFSNFVDYTGRDMDPIHLNDVEPVLYDGPYWKKGDVFVSIRHKSLVFLYRPESNQIIHLLYGPFLYQHDVDIISDKEVSIFNNNLTHIGIEEGEIIEEEMGPTDKVDQTIRNSEIVIYNFEDSTYRTHLQHQFEQENIFTETQGLHEILSTGDVFVESQNNGKLYIFNKDEVLLKKVFNTSIDNMVERPNWIKIYENINF